jgi:hypothetical protein
MDTADGKPCTLSREELYELVWSKALSSLAKDFGISDVALGKRCRRLKIPIPGRGYWARVEAGQKSARPKLPAREPEWRDHLALTLARSHWSMAVAPEEDGADPVVRRIAALAVGRCANFLETLPPVKRTAIRLKHPRRAELHFDRGERSGPVVPIEVTPEALERALLLADQLLKSAETLGWSFIDPASRSEGTAEEEKQPAPRHGRYAEPPAAEPKPPPEGRLLVLGEEVEIRIEERFREEPRVPSAAELAREKREYGYHAPRTTSIATGNLRVARLYTYGRYGGPPRRSWYDRKGTPVEDQIQEILLGCYEIALYMKRRRAKDENEAREAAEAERLREERLERQEGNAKLIKQLETDAGAWHRARYLRRYIGAARRRLDGEVIAVRYLKSMIDFLAWADRYVEQLDPLIDAPRCEDFERPSNDYGSDDEKWKRGLARLVGSLWKDAWKIGQDYAVQDEDSDNSWSYRERSVFEPARPGKDSDDDD